MSEILFIKRNVVSVTSAGASLTMPSSEGEIIEVKETAFGQMVEVRWTAGEKAGTVEPFMVSSIKTKFKGIGIYFA